MTVPLRSDADPDSATQVLRRFRVLFNAVQTHFRLIEKESGLGGAQAWALSLVAKQPGIGVGELAKHMDIHQSTASNLVKMLLKKELVTLSKSLSDKRAVQLHITAAGQLLLKLVPGPSQGVLPEALAQLDPATLERLNEDLARLTEVLQADDAAANTPLADLARPDVPT
jgi:DNA-binding MarR family transcriptional regulator